MGVLMNVYEILEFQRLNFPDIFYSYKKLDESNIGEKSIRRLEFQPSLFLDEITIFCEEYCSMLKNTFFLPEQILTYIRKKVDLEEIDEVILENSYIEDIKIHNLRSIEIYFTHPFPMKFYKIKLIKKLSTKRLSNTAIVLLCKKISFYDRNLIKNIHYLDMTDIINQQQQLEDFFNKLSISYNEKKYIEDLSEILCNESLKSHQQKYLEDYNICLGLEIVSYLTKTTYAKQKLGTDYIKEVVINKGLQAYDHEGKNILKQFLIKGKFQANFILVSIFLKKINKMENDMREFLSDTLVNELLSIIKNNSSKMDLQISLMGSNLLDIDRILERNIEDLILDIKSYVEKVV